MTENEIKTVYMDDYDEYMYGEWMNATRKFEQNHIYIQKVTEKPIKMGVNWSALGAVEPEKAVEYAELLKEAAELADSFKYNGYKVVYSR